jgi:glucosamine--fructose-6-phosphate aminotransferase (isomerizing)
LLKKDSPLVLGLGDGEFLLPDIPAFLKYTKEVIILDNGEMAAITNKGVSITRITGSKPVKKEITKIAWSPTMAEKSGYRHFMLKEIYEQPRRFQMQ